MAREYVVKMGFADGRQMSAGMLKAIRSASEQKPVAKAVTKPMPAKPAEFAGPLDYARSATLALDRIDPGQRLEMNAKSQFEKISATPAEIRAFTDARGGPNEVTSVGDIMRANRAATARAKAKR